METPNANEACTKEPKVGMRWRSEDEAYKFYNHYALQMGFSIRKGTKRYNNEKVCHQREFLCSKARYREFEDPTKVSNYSHLDTRIGCKATVRFNMEDGTWVISIINYEHNHELAIEEERCNLRLGRKITNASKVTISSMVKAGIKLIKSYSYLACELGGQNNVGFTKKDLHNFLHTEMEKMIEAGDGQSIINHFQIKQASDPMFFYSVQVDQYNRMTNFFWRDGRSKFDYEIFGDMVVFDTTYRTNRYNLVCAPFVGINHHWKNILFGCAFLLDETINSFTWLFETFKECMGGREPKSIFTDLDQVMANAIEKVFPNSHHRLCLWHISKNARQHLAGLYSNLDFHHKFSKCLNGCVDKDEFDLDWLNMIKAHGLEKHAWLNRLYELRMKWCPAFSKDIFSGRMKSTQRSESINSVFQQIMKTSMPLMQIIYFYEQKVEEMRKDKLNENFPCKNGALTRVSSYGGILHHAASVYTLTLYKIFEEEFMEATGLNSIEVSKEMTLLTYKISKANHKREHVVHYDQSILSISCNYKLFVSL